MTQGTLFSKLGCVVLLTAFAHLAAPLAVAETIYLACSAQKVETPIAGDDDTTVTNLYAVTLDEETGEAVLDLFATSKFNQADALACNQEGYCYLFNRLWESKPDLAGGGFIEEYRVGEPQPVAISEAQLTENTLGFPRAIQGVVLAAFHPAGALYGAAQEDDRLYTIDLDLNEGLASPTAHVVGLTGAVLVDGVALDIDGADMGFTADGRMFLWTNGVEPGLYEIFLPPDGLTDATAVRLPNAEPIARPAFATGLAILDGGAGNVAVSSTFDEIVEHSISDGKAIATFAMAAPGNLDHVSGDMAHTFDCLMRCSVEQSQIMAGETLSVDVELYHNANRTVRQAFEVEVSDASGKVLYRNRSRPRTFRYGDVVTFDLNVPTPVLAASGEYSVAVSIAGMRQGEARAECAFEITPVAGWSDGEVSGS